MQSEKPLPQPPRPRFLRFVALGVLFEIALVAFIMGLPCGNLGIEITNFAIFVHYPVLLLGRGEQWEPDSAAPILAILGLCIMALIWGILFFQMARVAGWLCAKMTRCQKRVAGVLAGMAGLALLASIVLSSLPQMPIPFTPTAEAASVVDGNNAFAVDLYQKLCARPGNIFFSPFSISTGLAMTSAGARGQTASEMSHVLHFTLPPEKIPSAFSTLITRMDRIQRRNRITLKSANALWARKDHPFVPDFLHLLRDNYFAGARLEDFKNSPGLAAAEINHWVDVETGHLIPTAIDPGTLTPDSKLVLSDAIYFKGKWKEPFKEKETGLAPFYVNNNKTVTVPTMHQKAEVKCTQTEDGLLEMLELPYSGGDLSMVILLPNTSEYLPVHQDVAGLEQKLTADSVRSWLSQLDRASSHETYVALPRFDTQGSFNLANDMKALGMTSAFNDSADFSGMDGTKNLCLSTVLHHAFVKVDEAGTEAAAVTLIQVRSAGIADQFIADHPFIFLIRENGSGSILFLGRIMDPAH